MTQPSISFVNGKYQAVINGKTVTRSNVKHLEYTIRKATGATSTPSTTVQTDQVVEDTRTDAEIAEDISMRFHTMDTMVQASLKGLNRSMIVSGGAGTGKSTGIMDALEASGAKYEVVKGFITARQMYALFYANRSQDSIIVFDDSDSIFSDEVCLNLLKAVTDSTDKRVVSWRTSRDMYDDEGENLPPFFAFHGSIIFITNKNFNAEIARGTKMAVHYEALRSRSHYVGLGIHSKREYVIRIKQVIESTPILSHVSGSTKVEIVEFIDEHKDNLIELSLRMVKKIADLTKINPTGWKKMAQVTLMA